MTELPKKPVSSIAPTLTTPQAPSSRYEPPAIIHQGVLETRAGSPLANPFTDVLDPDNPID